MANLGTIRFVERGSRHDSAAAFLLARSPNRAALVPCSDAEVEVRPDNRYVVVRFNGAGDAETARDQGLELAQAGLDLMSIAGTADLMTQKSSEEFLLAWRAGGDQIVRIHSTTTLSFTVSSPRISVRDAQGNEISESPTVPDHHPGFRYFRLSQTSEDLHEAYRNMYLSFELLLSSKHPALPGERERDWLARGLASADRDLDLGQFFRPSPSDVVDEVISRIYTATRLPLFHAKSGRFVRTPHGLPAERQELLEALDLLTKVVLAMSNTWYGARRAGGGVFFAWVYENLRTMYAVSRVLALRDDRPFRADEKDLTAERYASAIEMHMAVRDDPDNPRAPLLWAEVPVASLWEGQLTSIAVVGADSPMLGHSLENSLSLEGFDRLEYCDRVAVENACQPKRRFAR